MPISTIGLSPNCRLQAEEKYKAPVADRNICRLTTNTLAFNERGHCRRISCPAGMWDLNCTVICGVASPVTPWAFLTEWAMGATAAMWILRTISALVAAACFFSLSGNTTNWARGFGIGIAGSYESLQKPNAQGLPQTTGGTLPGFNTEGQQQFFAFNPTNHATVVADGEHWRISPQGYYFYGPLSLMGEYVISNQRVSESGSNSASRRLENNAWQVSAGWVLTGEEYGYGSGVSPRHPFNLLGGDWGAWQLVARYSQLNVDEAAFPLFSDPATSARSADAWSVGLNWYPNRNVTFRTSLTRTTFDGGSGPATTVPGLVTRKDENVLFTRVQLSF